MVMRTVALVAGLDPSWSVLGSLGLLLHVSVYNVAMGLVYVAARRWVPLRGWRRGALFGAVALALLVYPALISEAHLVVAEAGLGPTVYGVAMLSSLFILDGIVLEAIVAGLRRDRAPVAEPAVVAP
jgi:hypothetical protein